MTIRFSHILGGLIFLGAYCALPAACHASLISLDSDLVQTTSSARADEGSSQSASAKTAHPKLAGLPFNGERLPADVIVAQYSGSSGMGHGASQVSGGSSAQSAITEGISLLGAPPLAFRLSEAALFVPSPQLDGMLRPPRA